jgi:hypothetical protein
MQLLDEKSFIPPPYPYEMIERLNKSRKHWILIECISYTTNIV